MRTSRLGSTLTAIGGNRRAAEIVGINVPLVKTLCFVFVSVCCGLAGILVMAYAGTTDAMIGEGWLLWVIAIVIIGGGSLQWWNREYHRRDARVNSDSDHPHGTSRRQCADQRPRHCGRGDLACCCFARRCAAQEHSILANDHLATNTRVA